MSSSVCCPFDRVGLLAFLASGASNTPAAASASYEASLDGNREASYRQLNRARLPTTSEPSERRKTNELKSKLKSERTNGRTDKSRGRPIGLNCHTSPFHSGPVHRRPIGSRVTTLCHSMFSLWPDQSCGEASALSLASPLLLVSLPVCYLYQRTGPKLIARETSQAASRVVVYIEASKQANGREK